jgi:VCBS repeat-containing protein
MGLVTGSSNSGGLIGVNSGTVTNSFWDDETSGLIISAGGTGKNTIDMMLKPTFTSVGWDFTNIWAIKETFTYPFFLCNYWNDPPMANDDTITIDEDTILIVAAPGVLGNDIDPDQDIMTVTEYDDTSVLGIPISVNSDGGYNYDPTGSAELQALAVGESLIDTFNYTVNDGNGGWDIATVEITINGVNDLPIAFDDTNTTNEDTVLVIPAPGVLGNDFDPDASDILTVIGYDAISANGAAVVVNLNGGYNYDPTGSVALQALADGESLQDSFNYTVSDGNGGLVMATVNITVNGANDVPTIITTDVTQFTAGQPHSVDYNATDVDASDTLVWSLNSNATWLHIDSATGILSGTPSNTDVGTYWVNVSVSDGNGGIYKTQFTLEVLLDTDGDGIPDVDDEDDDNDDTPDTNDDFPLDPAEDTDTDSDGTGDNADTDDDGDGFLDVWEEFLGTNSKDSSNMPIDTDGDGAPDGDASNSQSWMDTDDDGDNVIDSEDYAPLDPNVWKKPTSEGPGDFLWMILIIIVVLIIVGLVVLKMMGKLPGAKDEKEEIEETLENEPGEESSTEPDEESLSTETDEESSTSEADKESLTTEPDKESLTTEVDEEQPPTLPPG